MDKTVQYIDNHDPMAMQEVSHALTQCICEIDRSWRDLVILCIGSDRWGQSAVRNFLHSPDGPVLSTELLQNPYMP